MSRPKPTYFDEIAAKAARRWDQLDADPELAAPTRLLFKQIDSPRHVLSELLQNAEDARATWARCTVGDGQFVFEHDGEDFDPESLGSLCRFGFSNKRSLRTIGFRGIGFKTTFSVGPEVVVETPTLAFRFHRQRFYEPHWIDGAPPLGHTRIRVRIEDGNREKDLLKNLEDWLQSPIPLLFFSSIQTLEIQGHRVQKRSDGEGPVPFSEWIRLDSAESYRLLKIASTGEVLPAEALEEVRRERGEGEFEPGESPLEIVLGIPFADRLYTILPTQVVPHLPFSCNAPFIQDPSRYKIKDPVVSPTNRWLLERAGRLAGEALTAWLENESLPPEVRAEAYELLPDRNDRPPSPLDEAVQKIVSDAMAGILMGRRLLLGHDGCLYAREECADLPPVFLSAWEAEEAVSMLAPSKPVAMHPAVPSEARDRLDQWETLDRMSPEEFLRVIEEWETLPRPVDDDRLFDLWAAVKEWDSQLKTWRWKQTSYPLVPVLDSDQLYRDREVLRMVNQDDRLTPEESEFLHGLVLIADRSFLGRFEREDALDHDSPTARNALAFYRQLSFETASPQRVFELACRQVFNPPTAVEDGIRLLRVAVKADLTLPSVFQYLCLDGQWRGVGEGLLFSEERYEGGLLSDAWMEAHCISDRYASLFGPEERQRFLDWLHNGKKNHLRDFPLPRPIRRTLLYQRQAQQLAEDRNAASIDTTPVPSTKVFTLHDFDWDDVLLQHWESMANEDPDLWAKVVEASVRAWGSEVNGVAEGRITRPKTNTVQVVAVGLRAAWLHRLQTLPCLREEKRKTPTVPSLLLRRTRETEPLLHIEKFVEERLDTDEARLLLDLLGVRRDPSAAKLMDRLSALSQSSDPPLDHLLDLYRALDSVWTRLDPSEMESLKARFTGESMVLDAEGHWQRAGSPNLFQTNGEDIPGVSVVHPLFQSLSLWDRIGVPHNPTFEAVLEWLVGLPSGTEFLEGERKRVSAVLGRSPQEALQRCGHWLCCAGVWTPLERLKYFVRQRTPETRGERRLFKAALRKIADFEMLSPGQVESFRGRLIPLEEALTYDMGYGEAVECARPPWLRPLALGLLRIQAPRSAKDLSAQESREVQDRMSAIELYSSRYFEADRLTLRPVMEGEQVGTDSPSRAVWKDQSIYVTGAEPAHHQALVEALESRFLSPELRAAIRACVSRNPVWIDEYFEAQYALRPLAEVERDLGVGTPEGIGGGNTLQVGEGELSVDRQPDSLPDALGNGDTPFAPDEEFSSELTNDRLEDRGQADDMDAEHPIPESRRSSPRAQVNPMKAWAAAMGFRWDDEHRQFVQIGGTSYIRKERGSHFWVLYNGAGGARSRYLEITSPLTERFEIRAEDWLYLENHPDSTYLVALRPDGKPCSLRAGELLALRPSGEVEVFAALYRIVIHEDLEALGALNFATLAREAHGETP